MIIYLFSRQLFATTPKAARNSSIKTGVFWQDGRPRSLVYDKVPLPSGASSRRHSQRQWFYGPVDFRPSQFALRSASDLPVLIAFLILCIFSFFQKCFPRWFAHRYVKSARRPDLLCSATPPSTMTLLPNLSFFRLLHFWFSNCFVLIIDVSFCLPRHFQPDFVVFWKGSSARRPAKPFPDLHVGKKSDPVVQQWEPLLTVQMMKH